MLQELLLREESKTLEFKEDASSLLGIVKTVVAFANTAGGTIVVGVADKTKKIVGLADPLEDETRIINKISECVFPLFLPNIDIQSYRKKTVILIQVPYATGPYHLRKDGKEIVFVRFGSTNRIADAENIATIKALAKNITFDEMPCPQASRDGIDWKAVENNFSNVNKQITKNKAINLGMYSTLSGVDHPTNGGILLFGKERSRIFPDAIIRCVRFAGLKRENSLDHINIDEHLPLAFDEVLKFINKNTFTKTEIGEKRRAEIPQYPPIAIREIVINSIIHADYSIKGSSIIVAIFDDRIEVTNPGGMPYGLSLEEALAGSSRARNRVIAKTFHHLKLVEQWGSGLQKIIENCIRSGLKEPKFEETGSQFRVTIYSEVLEEFVLEDWKKDLLDYLDKKIGLGASEAAKFWNIDVRSARRRLKELVDQGFITKVGISKNDPHSRYVSCRKIISKANK